MTERLSFTERSVLTTVALSHRIDCACEAACAPLKRDDEARKK